MRVGSLSQVAQRQGGQGLCGPRRQPPAHKEPFEEAAINEEEEPWPKPFRRVQHLFDNPLGLIESWEHIPGMVRMEHVILAYAPGPGRLRGKSGSIHLGWMQSWKLVRPGPALEPFRQASRSAEPNLLEWAASSNAATSASRRAQ